ncbi:MAG TPA: MerR family transcriptional regulator [Solirubrobacteraceae bacterium]|jgi:DNA-binding transcriptional MerR regulator|nr:MerR family transcriptional regulator [Solirubrobacteraceae bacterium]
MSDDEPFIQIGELAAAVGLTVRTLHHYDAIGLLVPAQRSQSGRRLYARQDVRRLYRIVALRRLGLGLAEIGRLLDASPDLAQAVRGHLDLVERQLELSRRLRVTLTRILELLESGHDPGRDEFINAIGVMIMSESYYTAEQQEQLAERRRALGEEGMAAAERDWAELIEAVRAEQAAGTDASDLRMQELAGRWRALIEQFTGGDEGVRESLGRMYREEGVQKASQGMVDPALMEYLGAAMGHLD